LFQCLTPTRPVPERPIDLVLPATQTTPPLALARQMVGFSMRMTGGFSTSLYSYVGSAAHAGIVPARTIAITRGHAFIFVIAFTFGGREGYNALRSHDKRRSETVRHEACRGLELARPRRDHEALRRWRGADVATGGERDRRQRRSRQGAAAGETRP